MPTVARRTAVLAAAALCLALTTGLSVAPWDAAHAAAANTSARPAAASAVTAIRAIAHAPDLPGLKRYYSGIPTGTRELIVVSASSWSSTSGTLSMYSRALTGPWHKVGSVPARLGANGLVKAALRHQDTDTTPAGIFFITSGFGRLVNPGARLPYHHLTNEDWWVEDRLSPYYNQMRRASQGGFALTTSGPRSSEHLAAMGTQYDYVAVIDFNRPHPVVGRGAGIFLHVNGRGATAGCVSVPWGSMRAILRWLDPALRPVIVIGPSSWLASRPG